MRAVVPLERSIVSPYVSRIPPPEERAKALIGTCKESGYGSDEAVARDIAAAIRAAIKEELETRLALLHLEIKSAAIAED